MLAWRHSNPVRAALLTFREVGSPVEVGGVPRFELSADGSFQRVRVGPVRVALILTALHAYQPTNPNS